MKKIVTLLLISTLTISTLTACSEETSEQINESSEIVIDMESDSSKTENGAIDVEETQEEIGETIVEENEESMEDTVVYENGELPDVEFNDLPKATRAYHTEILFKAFQELDTDTLSQYCSDSNSLIYLSNMKNDEQAVEFWNKIVGDMIYIPEDDILIAKSADYIFSKWYEQAKAENLEIPDEYFEKMTYDEAMEIYNLYYEEAPYIYGKAFQYVDVTIENGTWDCDIYEVLFCVDYPDEYDDYFDPRTSLFYGNLLMGEAYFFVSEDDYLAQEVPVYKEILDFDLNKIVPLMEEVFETDKESSLYDFYYEIFEKNYLNEENRAIVQQYLTENCRCIPDFSHLTFLYPISPNTDIGLNTLSEETLAILQEYQPYERDVLSLMGTSDLTDYRFFFDIARYLVADGVISE